VARAARAEDRLRILLRVSQLLSSPVPLDALLERILELLFQVLPVDRAAILLGEGDAGALEPKAVRSRQPLEPGERFYSQSIVRYVREHSVAAVFNDAQADSRLRDAPSVYRQSIRSSMCAPLKPKSVVLGVLYVDNQSLPGGFGEGDVEFLGAFANQAAIAIDNARLYERIEQDAVLRSNFLRFFPPNAARRILDAKEQALGVIDTEVTALFCDISGFTALSSQMAPRAVVELLNEYFPVMSEIVFRHEGTLEKYIGDALLAVWGAPFAQPDDVDRAIRAGIEMHRAIGRLNERRAQKGQFSIGIHIGVNTGPVAAGNIGSDRFLQYATIGDTTNVASRICGAAGDGELVIAAATAGRWQERHAPIEPLQAVVKGKAEPLELHRVRWDLVR
jgi:adenylate cyclase